jgi:hypothetical protein
LRPKIKPVHGLIHGHDGVRIEYDIFFHHRESNTTKPRYLGLRHLGPRNTVEKK